MTGREAGSAPSAAHDGTAQRHAAQTAVLVSVNVATRIYPTFVSVDRAGTWPVVTEVSLTWEEFQALAKYAMAALDSAESPQAGDPS